MTVTDDFFNHAHARTTNI